MVNPIYIIVALLGSAFLSGLSKQHSSTAARWLAYGVLLFSVVVSATWLGAFILNGIPAAEIFTAGVNPPFSINLRMGLEEAFLTLAINLAGMAGLSYLSRDFSIWGQKATTIFLVLIMSVNVVVMTRDLFNLFVFSEVGSIAMVGLIFTRRDTDGYSAGFKYLIAVSVISALLLLGIGFVYYNTGSLNIDTIFSQTSLVNGSLAVALFLVLISLVLELKVFPVNGWALDVYQTVNPGIGSVISGVVGTGSLYVLYKMLPLGGALWYEIVLIVGLVTFVGSNFVAISQKNVNRLLGYSSVAQAGLLMVALGAAPMVGQHFLLIAGGLFLSQFLAKSGLFWLAGMINSTETKGWAVLRQKPVLLVLFGFFVLALAGFPPFPSFFGKWQLVIDLAHNGQFAVIAALLIGSLFEAVYLFRWLGEAIKLPVAEGLTLQTPLSRLWPVLLFGILLPVGGYLFSRLTPGFDGFLMVSVAFALALMLLDYLPAWIKNSLTIAGLLLYASLVYSLIEGDLIRVVFAVIFVGGGLLTLIAGYSVKGKRMGFFPFAILMYAGLIGLIEAQNLLQFFFAWELMTLGSYILIIRGKKSMLHALNYMLFSLGGAYMIMMGISLSVFGTQGLDLALMGTSYWPVWSVALLALGFLTKTAALGLHIWLPGAHAEAESDVSPMVSGILLKAGAFGLVLLFLAIGGEANSQQPLLYALGWLGALTALGGNLMAAFQEDAKKLLAYSSVANLGYILFAFAFMTHIGWIAGFTYSINHFLFKTLLFLAIGGVVLRTGTHNMYEMGGLIKRMPWSFIAVLIGIITLAGIPPLSGFSGKWLFYHAVIAKGWYFQGTMVFFAGTIAFLYCFKLIYSIFLGQEKDHLRKVKEVPVWYIIPQVVLVLAIMVFSYRPDLILVPLGHTLAAANYFPTDPITWNGLTASTTAGYWNASQIMMVIGVMFVILLGWLLFMSRKAQKVKQFNIVFAAERPFRPETTHYSYNMFRHYHRAVGFLVAPVATRFWNGVDAVMHDVAHSAKKIYSGNGQTYIVHLLAYVVIIYLLMF